MEDNRLAFTRSFVDRQTGEVLHEVWQNGKRKLSRSRDHRQADWMAEKLNREYWQQQAEAYRRLRVGEQQLRAAARLPA